MKTNIDKNKLQEEIHEKFKHIFEPAVNLFGYTFKTFATTFSFTLEVLELIAKRRKCVELSIVTGEKWITYFTKYSSKKLNDLFLSNEISPPNRSDIKDISQEEKIYCIGYLNTVKRKESLISETLQYKKVNEVLYMICCLIFAYSGDKAHLFEKFKELEYVYNNDLVNISPIAKKISSNIDYFTNLEYYSTLKPNGQVQKLEAIWREIKPTTDMKTFNPTYRNIFVRDNTKLHNNLHKCPISYFDEKIVEKINVGKDSNCNNIQISLVLSSEEPPTGTSRAINQYDKLVLNAVSTIWDNGNQYFTLQMVCKIIAGDNKRRVFSPQMLDRVSKSIEKLSITKAYIDFTKQNEAYGFGNMRKNSQAYLLAIYSSTIEMNNHDVKAYKLLDRPILRQYADKFNQIVTFPLEALNIPDLSSTALTETIKSCLLGYVAQAKGLNKPNRIKFTTFYRQLDLETYGEKKMNNIRKYTTAILQHFVSLKIIKGYRSIKENNVYRYLEIKPHKS